MIDSFLKYLQFEKRLSDHTVLAYQCDLKQYSDFLITSFHLDFPEKADYGMIRSWIVSISENGLEATSVNRKIACLRSYYKFLQRNEFITSNPMMKLRVLKTKKKLPSFIKETEMVNLLDNNTRFSDDFEGWQQRLILELFYATGIRLSELLTLPENDIDFNNRTIKVLGKRSKERVIPFSRHLVTILKGYLEMKNRTVAKKNNLLLVTDKGDPCYPMLVYRIVKTNLALFTSADKKSPHVLRHTYATHLLNKGAEINAVKDLLGHTSLAATQVYTHNTLDKLKEAFEQAHPKA